MTQDLQTVAAGKVVGIYFTLKDEAGRVIESNRRGGKPLAYLQGAGNLLPALERALDGRRKNDFVQVTLSPEEAYGERRPEGIRKLPRSSFPRDREVLAGQRYSGTDPEGRPRSLLVVEVGEEEVTVDENHPLAGQRLTFEVTVCGVRDPTREELAHGHPHGPGGHAH